MTVFIDPPIAFAHRGGSLFEDNIGIENTMEAFSAAINLGYRYIESDVQVSSDGEIFIFHDDDLNRLVARPGMFRDHTAAEIDQMLVGGKARIPRFAEVLSSFPEIKFNIDLKTPATVEPAIRAVRAARASDRVVFASFSATSLQRARSLAPEIATTMGPGEAAALKFARMKTALSGGAIAAQVPVSRNGIRVVTKRFVDRAHEHGLQIHVWTIDDAEEMKKLLDLGVDGLVSDRIDVLKSVMTERGLWR